MAINDIAQNGANVGASQGGGEAGSALLEGLRNFATELGQALPDILAAILVLILGIIVAGVLGNLVRKLVIWSRVDKLVESTNSTTGDLDQAGIKFRVADVAGTLVKWVVILLVITIAADILQWTQISELMNSLIAYLPNVAAAILLLVGGYLLGNFVGTLVSGMGESFGKRAAQAFGSVARVAIFVVAAMAALIQLGIAETIIQIAFVGLMAMISLAGGLAFGLGGRDKARELLSSEIGARGPAAA